MERPRTLVVHYSRSGHTRRLGRAIADALGADVEEIRDRTDRSGLLGYLRGGLEVLLEASAEIDRPKRDPADYDLVVVGSPVWVASVATPVRTYLWLERERLPAVAFFATLGGMGSDRAFRRMRAIVGKAPAATLAVREAEIARGVPPENVARFAEALLGRQRRGARRRKARAAS